MLKICKLTLKTNYRKQYKTVISNYVRHTNEKEKKVIHAQVA